MISTVITGLFILVSTLLAGYYMKENGRLREVIGAGMAENREQAELIVELKQQIAMYSWEPPAPPVYPEDAHPADTGHGALRKEVDRGREDQ